MDWNILGLARGAADAGLPCCRACQFQCGPSHSIKTICCFLGFTWKQTAEHGGKKWNPFFVKKRALRAGCREECKLVRRCWAGELNTEKQERNGRQFSTKLCEGGVSWMRRIIGCKMLGHVGEENKNRLKELSLFYFLTNMETSPTVPTLSLRLTGLMRSLHNNVADYWGSPLQLRSASSSHSHLQIDRLSAKGMSEVPCRSLVRGEKKTNRKRRPGRGCSNR